jgi:pilus assembly protein CpaF
VSLLQRLKQTDRLEPAGDSSQGKVQRRRVDDGRTKLKQRIHETLIDELGGDLLRSDEDDAIDELRNMVRRITFDLADSSGIGSSDQDKEALYCEVLDEIVGFGPITPLLQDSEITEVMVNGPNQVYVERGGRIEATSVRFRDADHVLHTIERIVAPIGRRIDEGSPMVDARLPDGSRVNAIVPPLSLVGPCLTIRKFSKDPFSIDDLIAFGTLTRQMADFLEACVKSRLNIIVSGGTGSGKTTLLNVLSSFIPPDERIVTIEDSAELQLRQEHVITLETRPPNIEGKGAVSMRDLVRNSLRMRPDRIVVGEVRSGEALDMLQAMNTGHDGSLTTAHANSPRDLLSRLETMVLMAGMDIPVKAIREQIASAVDLIIQQARLRDGSRRITQVTEVQGMEGDVITLQDIFVFTQTGIDGGGRVQGQLRPTGIRPKFYDTLIANGATVPLETFFDMR